MTTTRVIDRSTLNDAMEVDHVIRVDADGAVEFSTGVYAPELIDEEVSDGWELLDGYSGQWCYSGPIMHPSEYVGGRLADDILSTPGYYVVVVNWTTRDVPDLGLTDDDVDGWAVAYRPL